MADRSAESRQESANLTDQSIEPVRQHGNSWRAMLTRDALRGLDYSTGRVTVDLNESRNVIAGLNAADAIEQYESGRQALDSGLFLDAIGSLTRSVILEPDNAQFLESLGSALLAKRKPILAEAAFRTVLDLDPSALVAHQQLALTLSGTGRRDESIQQYRKLLDLEPENGMAHSRLAIQLYYSGQFDQSRQHADLAEFKGYAVPPQFLALLNRDAEARDRPAANPLELNAGAMPDIGVQTRVDLNNGDAGNETTASASDLNSNTVVAGWNDYRTDDIRAGFALTFDGGETWEDFLLRPPTGFGSSVEGDPMTCFDNRTGDLWAGAISFGSNGGVYVARLNAGDTQFQPSVMAEISGGADKGWMAAGPDPLNSQMTRLYIGYNQGLLVSTDNGDTWSGPTQFPASGLGWLPRVGPNGEVYISYWDIGDRHRMIRSLDGGATFQGPFTIGMRMDVWFVDGTRFPGRFRVAPLSTMAVDPVDGTLYATWFDTTEVVGNNSNVDIYFSRSLDQGTTWSTPAIVNSDSAVPGDQFFSWIEVDAAGRLHLLFYDTRAVPQNDNTTDGPGQPPAMIEAWYSFSDDGGETWSEFVLTPAPFSSADDGFGDGFIGDYLGMAVSGSTAYPCYMSTQEGIANIYVHAITNGFLLGDINRDGVVNLLDIGPFVDLLTRGTFDKAGDINGDGAVNLLDVGPFVDLLQEN